MRLLQYTLARYSSDGAKEGEADWFDKLTRLGVVGTIDATRLVPSLKVIHGLTK